MGIPYNHVPMEQLLYCKWLWRRPFASHFVVKRRVPSSSLSHAAGFLASKATFDSKPALRHNLRVQLRLSIFQSIEHPKGCSVALIWGHGAKLQTGGAARTSISEEPHFSQTQVTGRYPATSPICQNIGR